MMCSITVCYLHSMCAFQHSSVVHIIIYWDIFILLVGWMICPWSLGDTFVWWLFMIDLSLFSGLRMFWEMAWKAINSLWIDSPPASQWSPIPKPFLISMWEMWAMWLYMTYLYPKPHLWRQLLHQKLVPVYEVALQCIWHLLQTSKLMTLSVELITGW